jgi:hypothetical protein
MDGARAGASLVLDERVMLCDWCQSRAAVCLAVHETSGSESFLCQACARCPVCQAEIEHGEIIGERAGRTACLLCSASTKPGTI